MNYRNINRDLQMKIRRYIEYMHDEKKKGSQRGVEIVNYLSSHLRDEIKYDSYKKIIFEIKFLKQNFSQKLLIKLTNFLEEITYGPEEIIFRVKNK